ncbi:flagellar biosynthetic protein FliO [Massilia sp. ST3]|nr:flagellar biosynthetic protein FliO [Massilia sp. ST3]
MTKRNVAVTDIVGLAASLPTRSTTAGTSGTLVLTASAAKPPTLRVFAAALLFAPLAACAAPLPAEQAAPAVQQTAPAPVPAPASVPEAAAPAPAAQEPATTPRRAGETTTGRVPAPARPAPSVSPANTPPVPAPLPADGAQAPAGVTPQAPIVAPAPAPAERTPRAALPGSPSSPAAGSLMQTILALVLVLAVLAGLAWFLKRFAPKMMGGANSNLRMVGSLNLGGRERIMVVEVGDQWIVVGASPGRINALATMPRQAGVEGDAAVAATGAAPSGSFSDWLKNTIDKRNAK